MHLKRSSNKDIVFEWVPYNHLSNIEEINKGNLATIYLAIWNDGPLYCDYNKREYARKSYKNVVLKCIRNSQNINNEFFNEV